jgi:hypothetical protein
VKKLLALPLIFALSGCAITAVPVTAKFPDAPITLTQKCEALKESTEGVSISLFTKTVVENYMLYHECERKVVGWNEWYIKQKEIFETATKK